jgi:hypothetical protein
MASSQKHSPPDEKRLATRRKVSEFRRRQREKGLRLVQIWVPDVNSPEFIAEARRQSRAVAQSSHEAEDQAFIDSVSEIWSK